MTKNQLRYFVAIVDCGSYLEAALELDMPQSSISKQIQALERELGVDLFDRKARKAKLTPEGKSLLPEARAVLERMEHLSYAASRLRSGHTKRILVGTLPFIGYLGLYPSLVRFERENPDYLLTVMEMEEPQLMRRMLGDECDLILNYEYEYRLANVGRPFFPLTDDEVVLAVHETDPLAGREAVSLDDIADAPLMLMEPYTCIAKLCLEYFRAQQFTPNVIFRGRPETIYGGAAAQRCGALLTRKQAQSYTAQNTVVIPLKPALPVVIGAIPGKNEQNREQAEQLVRLLTSSR